MNNLFVYGTLQSGKSRNRVLKGLPFERGQIQGYEKIEPISLEYPLIVKKKGMTVNGEVYFNLSESVLARIDSMEGELYYRIVVDVITTSGKQLKAYAYYPSEELIRTHAFY
ncbi:MAG: gamma-glutamylcyclotransferase [Candidatus Lokiarchaeota archaeon]|nr:gamma-glutamylcyclotransferase [Candidatus Lokiarchaeota archaeon]